MKTLSIKPKSKQKSKTNQKRNQEKLPKKLQRTKMLKTKKYQVKKPCK